MPLTATYSTSSHSPMICSIDDGTLSGFASSIPSMRLRAASIRSAYWCEEMGICRVKRVRISMKSGTEFDAFDRHLHIHPTLDCRTALDPTLHPIGEELPFACPRTQWRWHRHLAPQTKKWRPREPRMPCILLSRRAKSPKPRHRTKQSGASRVETSF